MKPVLRIGVAAGALVMTSCGLLGPDSWADRQDDLDRNREVWEAAGIDAYTYALDRSCYCGAAGDLVVTVAGGAAVVAFDRGEGTTVSEAELQFVETVDDLFDTAQRAIDQRAYRYRAEYHPELGYPTLIDLDPDRNAIDEELKLVAADLVPTDRGT